MSSAAHPGYAGGPVLLGGALLGALVLRVAPIWAPALAAASVINVVVVAAGLARRMAPITDRRGGTSESRGVRGRADRRGAGGA